MSCMHHMPMQEQYWASFVALLCCKGLQHREACSQPVQDHTIWPAGGQTQPYCLPVVRAGCAWSGSPFFLRSGFPFLTVAITMSPGAPAGSLLRRAPKPTTEMMYRFLAPAGSQGRGASNAQPASSMRR